MASDHSNHSDRIIEHNYRQSTRSGVRSFAQDGSTASTTTTTVDIDEANAMQSLSSDRLATVVVDRLHQQLSAQSSSTKTNPTDIVIGPKDRSLSTMINGQELDFEDDMIHKLYSKRQVKWQRRRWRLNHKSRKDQVNPNNRTSKLLLSPIQMKTTTDSLWLVMFLTKKKNRTPSLQRPRGTNIKVLMMMLIASFLLLPVATANNQPSSSTIEGCKFYPAGENRRFERVAENLPVGSEIFKLEAHPRGEFKIEPIDNSLSDVNYFKFVDIDDRFVAIKLNQSLEDLVDRRDPQNVLKFKLTCRGIGSQEDAFLPVTVYIHDVNDHAPEFQNVPYHLEVDELTPVGLTIFRSIHAIDRDKPNTLNSDLTYSIVGGNENDSFILSDPIEGTLVMNKPLDYDHGKREYKIQIQASDHGTPSLSSVTTMTVKVKDADDQNPIFSHEIYTASVSESAQITGKRVREKVRVEPPIAAYDQDTGINARLRYNIILGNEAGFFEMNAQTGELFLVREIDLERLPNPILALQIQASQVDNPFRQALARVDITVQDINDNSPEFEYDMYNITVIENLPPGFTVLQVFATDSDQAENAQFKYVLHDDSGAFKIDPNSGWISVKDPTKLDRETTDKIRMQVSTLERKPNVNPDVGKRKRGASVEINLLDSNDNTPFFVGAAASTQHTRTGTDSLMDPHSNIDPTSLSGSNCVNVSGANAESADCVVPINLYTFNVLETATPGTQIGHVYAYDRDLGDNGRVQYFKQNDSISLSAPFDVNPLNGSIYVLPQFTRLARKQSSYTLFVKAIDSALIHFERRHSVAVVQINVTDINNSVPEFIGTTPFEAYVGESLPEGAFVTQIHARDDDSITEQLEYSIVAGNDEKLFLIDSKLGKIYTSAVLDFERKQTYDLLVQVSDGVNTAVAPLIINIIDINDQQPVFAHQFYNFTVMEEAGANQTVGQLLAVDRDSGKNALLHYSLTGDHANDAFVIDPQTGVLRTRRSLDCEVEPIIDFQIVARDSGIPQLSGTASVRVRVDDINDWAPRFEFARYELDVQEELEAPVDVTQLRALDRDHDDNAIIKYLIIGGNELGLFNINADTGQLSTAARLDYETKREHRLQVAARNVKPFQGPKARTIVNPAVEILIKVSDINDELVVFDRTSYHWRLSELTAKNTIIGRVNASNLHRGSTEQDIVYWLGPVQVLQANSAAAAAARRRVGANDTAPGTGPALIDSNKQAVLSNKLWIDERSGELVLTDQLDRDAPNNEHMFRFNVFARDKRSINKLNVSAPVVIDILDANDNAPMFDESLYQLEMPENLPAGTTIPAFFKVHDADSGLNGRIAAFYINGTSSGAATGAGGPSNPADIFHINNVTGTITLRSPLDYERQSVHKFEVLAQDGGQPSALIGSAKVIVQVTNINEFSPKFINLPYEYQVQENAVPGTQIGQVRAIDQDGNKVYYSLSDGDTDSFAIEPTTGKIYVSRQLAPRTQYNFIVRATDDGQPQNYSLGVQVLVRVRDTNDFAPVFTSSSYTATVVEKSYKSSSGNLTLVRVEAIDKDLQNNTVSYSIVSGNDDFGHLFTIDKRTGEIRVAANAAARIDYDKRKQYTLLVQAQDSHETPLVGLTMVQIDVLDVNDHAPLFSKPAYVASISESAQVGTCFARIEADSRDSVDSLVYSLAGQQQQQSVSAVGGRLNQGQLNQTSQASSRADSAATPFDIHPIKGLLCTRMQLDREQRGSYELTVVAYDGRYESQATVSVEILDENDNRPVFDFDQYAVSLPYDSQPGRTVANVHAIDSDAGANGLVQYWIKNTHGLFQIDAKTGQVRLVTRLPAPTQQQLSNSNATQQQQVFELRIFAQDGGTSPQIGETTLLVRLTTLENHPPKFDRFVYTASVDENISGVPLLQVQASDSDPGKAGKIVYRLARVQSASLLRNSVSTGTGGVGSQSVGSSSSSSQSSASGGGQNQQSSATSSHSNHKLAPEQQQTALSASQLERLRGAFKVDKSSGKVFLIEPLDYEELHNVELIIEARDEALHDSQSTSVFVQIQVNDINDNKPELLSIPKVLRVASSTQPMSEVIYTIQAIDADSAANGNNQIEYRLETPSKYFAVNPQTGVLYATTQLPSTWNDATDSGADLDPELDAGKGGSVHVETLTVIASDRSATHPMHDRQSFLVEVYKDQADDARPIFNSNQYFVQSESAVEPGTVILTPRATVPNGDQVLYNISLVEQHAAAASSSRSSSTGNSNKQQSRSLIKRFAIDSETGRISTTTRLEPNELSAKNVYHFIVKASNKQQPNLFSETGVIVRLMDGSHRCPRFPYTEYYASVPENARIDSIAVPNLVIDDVERFAGQKLSYQITEDNSNDNFFIDVASSSTGNQQDKAQSTKINVSLRVKKALDRELMPKFLGGVYTLTVSASNARCATQARVKILVEDQNDNSPVFDKSDYYVELRENSPIGHVVSQLQANDADELDVNKLRYFIADAQPEGSASVFEMEQKSGTISVKSEIDRERTPKHLLRIMAADGANNTGWTNLHVQVLDENDWSPTFVNETFYMNATEGPASIGTRIRLPVYDYDDGLNRQMEVYIVEGNSGNEFRLDVDEGGPLLTIVQELDWERYSSASFGSNEFSSSTTPHLPADSSIAVHNIQIAAKDKGLQPRIGKTTVVVYLNDINDNAPKFVHESYYEFIDENAPVGSVVATVRATDADSPANTNLTYSFVRRASKSNGPTATAPSAPMPARVPQSSPPSPVTGTAPQPVGLLARPRKLGSDSDSRFSSHRLVRRQASSMTSGVPGGSQRQHQFAAAPTATSSGINSALQTSQSAVTSPFALDPITGVITVARPLDISEQQQYILSVEAYDGLWASETQVRVFINEVEDPMDVSARSSETANRYRFQVKENQPDSLVGVVDLKPRKLRSKAQMRYSIVNGEMRQLFRISQSGEILTVRGLDREQRAQYTFTVMLEERRGSSKLTVAEVIVDVLDENDEIPTFMHVYYGTIRENSPPNTPLFLMPTSSIKAVDNDTRNNSQIVYSLTGSGADRFQIQPNGAVYFAPQNESIVLDREQRAEYKLDVHATDNGNLSSKTTLSIKVEDENDNAPVFETGPLFVLIPETAKAGSKIVQVRARDRDEPGPNSEIHYRISGSQTGPSPLLSNNDHYGPPHHHLQHQQQVQLSDVIRIDQSTGELFVVGQLQPGSSYNISVAAVDSGGLSANTQVNVTVVDVNDHKPVFDRPSYSFVVFEGNYSRQALKLATLRAQDEDLGRNGQIEYVLVTDPQYEASLPPSNPAHQLASLLQSRQSGGNQTQQLAPATTSPTFPISVDVRTGELYARGLIDREQRDTFIFKVMAVDMGEPSLNSTCEVVIKVKDINDEPPRFYTDPYLALVPENLEPGHKVTQIAAFDPDSGDNGQVFYKLGEGHEGKFYIDGKDGTVWTLASLDYEQKSFYNITIIAYDRGSPSLHSSAKLWITVADTNDAVPNFAKSVYTIEVAENAKLGDTIFALNAGKGSFKYSWLLGSNSNGAGGSSNDLSGDLSGNGNGLRPFGSAHHHHHHHHRSNNRDNNDDDGIETFSIEPNTGYIRLARSLDSVQRNHYRLMVKAQDESEPPKFDTAEINILVGTGQGVRLFAQRVYEVSVLENQLAPLMLFDLNCTDEMIHQPVRYTIVGSDHKGLFRIEPDTGRLSVTFSLDRERRDTYALRIKAETGNLNVRQKRHAIGPQSTRSRTSSSSTTTSPGGIVTAATGRHQLQQQQQPAPHLAHELNELEARLYTQTHQGSLGQANSKLTNNVVSSTSSSPFGQHSNASLLQTLQAMHLAYDETFVLITVEDENDNAPVFTNSGGNLLAAPHGKHSKSENGVRPIVSAVPLEASFGYEIARVQVRDADTGLNAQIRYELQARNDDATSKFYIDPQTGVVRSMVNFALDSERVYNFDVRATDRDGADGGNSASIQVFVYVLPETKMVLMVTDTEPIVMEKRSNEVIGYLSNITGFDVKLAKLEPHIEGESPEPFSTDMFLYAVNPSLNNIVDTETLLNVFRQSSQTILSHLYMFKIRRIQGVTVQEKISQMGATEIAIIALSSIVFVGSIVAILLLCSCKQTASRHIGKSSNSSQQSIWDQQRAYSLKNHLMSGLSDPTVNGGLGHTDGGGGVVSHTLGARGDKIITTGSSSQTSGTSTAHAHSIHHHHLHHHPNGNGNGNNASYLLSTANSNVNTPRAQTQSQSTYSTTGDGANSSVEYVDSLISYKRSSGGSGGAKALDGVVAGTGSQHAMSSANVALGRARGRSNWPAALDSELAAVMSEHHLHHHHLHHQSSSRLGAGASSSISTAGALIRGPRARLIRSTNDADPNTEVHSDNEIFDDEDDEDGVASGGDNNALQDVNQGDVPGKPAAAIAAAAAANDDQAKENGQGSIRSADRSIYSGESNWSSGDELGEGAASGSIHMIDHTIATSHKGLASQIGNNNSNNHKHYHHAHHHRHHHHSHHHQQQQQQRPLRSTAADANRQTNQEDEG